MPLAIAEAEMKVNVGALPLANLHRKAVNHVSPCIFQHSSLVPVGVIHQQDAHLQSAANKTRLSFGNAQGSGLWYLPHGEEDESMPRQSLQAPIIAARETKCQQYRRRYGKKHAPKTNRAMIRRRTESSGLRPISTQRSSSGSGEDVPANVS